jgi:hypothetical protein
MKTLPLGQCKLSQDNDFETRPLLPAGKVDVNFRFVERAQPEESH